MSEKKVCIIILVFLVITLLVIAFYVFLFKSITTEASEVCAISEIAQQLANLEEENKQIQDTTLISPPISINPLRNTIKLQSKTKVLPISEILDDETSLELQEEQIEEVESEEIKEDVVLEGQELYESYVDDICTNVYPDVPASIIKAMIWRESRWKAETLGDHGTSYGLMQIKPKWHQERMDRLGVTDLLDPYGNILVGCDLMHELISKYDSYACALMCYNGGTSYGLKNYKAGNISKYAKEVLEEAGYSNEVR